MAAAVTRVPDAGPLLLSVEQVGFRVGAFRVLDGVDLRIRPAEVVALAGENGAGKSTLVRCIAGDIAPTSGRIVIRGVRVDASARSVAQPGVAVVWQDPALCGNLDIASNLLLGHEDARLFRSETRLHRTASSLLEGLGISLHDTTRSVETLSGGQRRLLAVARAMHERPHLLILDEPTTALGVAETAQVEQLAVNVREQGTAVLLISHDVEQMFRLADRIAVLRQGRLVADVETAMTRPDEIVALITGQHTESSARRQLSRLHGLADSLVSADPSSSLALILSALGAALETDQLCIHLAEGERLRAVGALGLPPALIRAWAELPFGAAGGPVGLAAASEKPVVDPDVRSSPAWGRWTALAEEGRIGSSWAIPVVGAGGLTAVITVFGSSLGNPQHEDLNLIMLYAGYVATVIERERLLGEVTARNRALETIQEMLETLAGPIPLGEGVVVALQALRGGLGASEVALLDPGGALEASQSWIAVGAGAATVAPTQGLVEAAGELLGPAEGAGRAQSLPGRPDGSYLGVTFAAADGPGALVARWLKGAVPIESTTLLEDAANSLRLARERQESERARREASALRRSQELQRSFLSRLSHELRTPLTAIGGYASSLMQPDVTWDGDSERRFLSRISMESARLNRLVDDLLDFSAIESSTLRLQADWCDLALVLDAAIACAFPADASRVTVSCPPALPAIWADHDRLEQVFVNLLDNAVRHNPPGTAVRVEAADDGEGCVVVSVADDGGGMPEEISRALFAFGRRRTPTSGAGLGLSIAKAIIEAHGGQIRFEQLSHGTRFSIRLPIEHADPALQEIDEHQGAGV